MICLKKNEHKMDKGSSFMIVRLGSRPISNFETCYLLAFV
uniref:Uncharacterized protein n=1 Tax=Arundo donax TaxID=35708 RepID=A0A0A9BJ26_ARUDO